MESLPFLQASNATAMLGAAILAALFGFLYRRFGYRYLRLWQWSFVAAAGYLGLALAGLALIQAGLPATAPLRLASTTLAQACGYIQLFLLLAGVWEFCGGRALPDRLLRLGMLLLAGLGLALTLAFAFDPAAYEERLLLRVGLRYLTAAAAFLLAAWWSGRGLRQGAGQANRFVMLGFLAYGGAQLAILCIFLLQLQQRTALLAGTVFGLVDLLFQTLLGGMLALWLLDRERQLAAVAQRRIHALEHFDPLTALPNREHFLDEARSRLQGGSAARLLLVEIEGLRPLQGLDGGQQDLALLHAARRLEGLLPAGTLVGRLRGDELGALLRREPSGEPAVVFGQRIVDAFRQPFWVEQRALLLGVRVGLADAPEDASAIETLLALAERALAQDGAEEHSVRLASASASQALLADLHDAVVKGAMELYWQPIVQRDGRVGAFEALLRWKLADGRILSPEDFLSAMRQPSFTAALDQRVLEMALAQLVQWHAQIGPWVRIAVNLSTASLREADFASRLLARIAGLPIAPAALELEITETAALVRPALALRLLEELRAGGVEISLDDFGTGFSALTHLRGLPVHRIKLDRSFVAELPQRARDVAIVTALTTLAHALELQVTAEGVESAAQSEFLRTLGVDAQQGFLHGRPMPAAEVPGWLAARMDRDSD